MKASATGKQKKPLSILSYFIVLGILASLGVSAWGATTTASADVYSATIQGKVTDQNGNPLQGIPVTLYTEYEFHCFYLPACELTEGSTWWDNAQTASTDANGNYSFGGLSSSTHYCALCNAGNGYSTGNYQVQFGTPGPYFVSSGNRYIPQSSIVFAAPGSLVAVNAALATYACSGNRPALNLSSGNIRWASYSDYVSGVLSIDFTISNPGGSDALGVMFTDYVNNPGSVTVGYPYPDSMNYLFFHPLRIGDIPAGTNKIVTIPYQVPQGVGSFMTSIHATANDSCGDPVFAFPSG